MNIASFPNPETSYSRLTEMAQNESYDWAKVAACGSLVAGGLLLLTGHKRAGLVMAASGTALALMDHEETLKRWWEALPGYVDRAQSMFEQVRDVMEGVAEKGESLRRVISREDVDIAG
ncbi:MAG: hypothetical protein JST28_04370 [Acidobacteria bacterium]|nr:hypothetical protein [Acidobacteriota bacterium]